MDDDILREFVAEAREHLATIESDLLAIEEAGADIDEDRVNKVFRAAHSIKGASGFFGLEKIKELAHKAETVLDLIRSRKLTPNGEITNLLLGAFDKLREMVNDPGSSQSADTQSFLTDLVELAKSGQTAGKAGLIGTIVSATGTELPVVVQETVVRIPSEPLPSESRFVYQVQFDLFADVEQHGRTLSEFIRDLNAAGEIRDCNVDGDSPGFLESPGGRKLPTKMTFVSRTKIDPAAAPFFLSPNQVTLISAPAIAEAQASAQPAQESVAAPPPASPPSSPAASANGSAAPAAPPRASTSGTPTLPANKEKEGGAAAEGTLRVSVGLLESLMNLAGELVLSRNQLRAVLNQSKLRGVQASFQRVNLVTSELQDAIMQTRMQPIGNVFAKFPRVVRDISRTLKKDIQLDIRGKDVGLDKSLIEGLSDPLTHMVRNAADHGIESVEERLRVGKRATGTVRIEARHEAGQVVLEIADDGKGLDPNKIAAAAVYRGLITPEAMQTMSDQEKMHLIFLPGLSTAEKVTEVSGRGVGMDVVKTNLARLGGKVDIISEVGQGTLFRIKLPLTLAIIPSLVVSVNDERFAIPQISVVELLRIRAEKVKERIEVIGDAEVLVLREELIPIVRFADILGIKRSLADPTTGEIGPDRRERLADRRSPMLDAANGGEEADPDAQRQRRAADRRQNASSDLEIVVVHTGAMKYGLVVEHFHTGEEIVVKPLGRHLKGLPEYAGATIMGDGTVALIIDAAGLAAKAQLSNVVAAARQAEVDATAQKLVENRSFLLFYNAPGELCATPLESVVRVEKATHKQIENIGGKRTMQYRGNFLPVVTLSDVARLGSIGEDQDIAVIVVKIGEREVGLIAAMPVDVIETKVTIDVITHRQTGIAGSTIIREATVLVADIFEIAQTMFPEWNLARTEEASQSSQSTCQVILAEDSDFFRAQVKRYLESDGFSVLEAEDGEVAWKLLQEHADSVQAIVTDIEMPNLTGLGLATRIRQDARMGRLPILALTSLASDEDIAKGKAAGVDEYQIKLDRDSLLISLRNLIARRGDAVSVSGRAEEIQDGA
jgi:two-component system, chemotaxis family, sensor kinase CheA